MKRSTYTLRRLLALVLVLVMVGSLFAGCNKKDPDPTDPSVPNETIAETAEPTDATEEPTEEPTEAPTEPVETVPPVLMGTVNADNLNVRSEPYSTSDILKRLAINTRIEILEQKIVDGVNWGRIAEGWVNLNYVTIGVEFPEPGSTVVDNPNNAGTGSNATNATTSTTGTVTTGLNIRKESNADSASVGTYKKGDKVTILERNGDWGRTNKGWINTKYVDFTNSVTADSTSSSSSSGTNSTTVSNGNKAVLGYGTVVKTTSLAIRSGPGANYTQVSYVRKGERHPYYQTSSNGWVRFEKGWVNADYLDLEYAVESGTEATVTATTLSVREEADYNSERLATLEKGDEVVILETNGTWGMIEYASGQYGWIDLDQVKLPTPTVSNYTTGIATITADALHIREKASASSESLGTYKKGDQVTITEVSGNWGKTEDGWINLKYTKMEKTFNTGTGTVTASSLNIREKPSASSEDLGSLKKGEKVTILDTEGNWGKIEYKTGEYGWISLNYVNMTSTSTDSSGSTIISGKYKVTVKTPDNGTLKASASTCGQGSTVTLTSTPATGYQLESVSVVDADGNAVAVTNNKSFTMPASDVTVTATFIEATVTKYDITMDVSGSGSVTTNPADEAAKGTKVYLTVSPDAGYALSSISIKETTSGKTVNFVSNSYFTMPEADVTITASFAESTATYYDVTIDTLEHGSIQVNKSSAMKGDTVSMTITPEEGYSLKSISVKYVEDSKDKTATVSGSGNSRTFKMPEADVTITAEFAPGQYDIDVSKTGSGTVTVNPSKCAVGTEVTVTVAPATGYQLADGGLKVYGSGNKLIATGDETGVIFTMPGSDVTVKAIFELIPHDITITAGAEGTVTANKTTAGKGETVKLTIEPDEGYQVDTITLNGKALSASATSFTMPAEDADVEVTFKLKSYTIKQGTTSKCKVSLSPASATMGETVTVTITSTKSGYDELTLTVKSGSTELAVTEDSSSLDNGVYTYVYTFEMPAGNVTVNAAFNKTSS